MRNVRACRFLHRLLPLIFLLVLFPRAVAAQDAPPEPFAGRVEGEVRNLTPGAPPPTGIPVVLYLLQGVEPLETFTSIVASEGRFTFPNIPLAEGWTYYATVEYQSVTYGSPFVSFDGLGDVVQLSMDVYEASPDPADIRIGRLHVIVEFDGGNMRVSELYIVDNLGDRVFAGPPGGGTLELPLPEAAMRSSVERGMGEAMVPATSSIIRTSGGYRDTFPVRPGTSTQQLMVTYELLYDGEATVSHPLPYPARSVSVFLPDLGLTVESDQLTSRGSFEMGGRRLVRWDAADLMAGDVLSFRVSGSPGSSSIGEYASGGTAAQSSLSVAAGDNPTTWAVGAGGLAVSVALVLVLWNQPRVGPGPGQRETLLRAIVSLDVARAAGQIPAGRYELEREQLKSALRKWYQETENG